MGIIVNVVIIAAAFGYGGWALYRSVQKSKQGKCASCASKNSKSGSCCATPHTTIGK